MYTAPVEEQNEVDFCSSDNLSAEEAGLAMPLPNTCKFSHGTTGGLPVLLQFETYRY